MQVLKSQTAIVKPDKMMGHVGGAANLTKAVPLSAGFIPNMKFKVTERNLK